MELTMQLNKFGTMLELKGVDSIWAKVHGQQFKS
jgi:hypothetical protein